MNTSTALSIIVLAAFVHATFQLSISVLTLLSSNTLGAKFNHAKLMRLTTSFIIGAGIMTTLLLSTASLIVVDLFNGDAPQSIWAAICGMLIGVAVSVWLFYYRHEKGTVLWVPRSLAHYLVDRIKTTKLAGEAFGLGLTSVIGETIFIIAPLSASALVLTRLSTPIQIIGIIIYVVISMLPLVIVWMLIGGGHKLSEIQKWREDNKRFLQFTAGAGLIALAFFIYVNELLTTTLGLF